MRHINGWTRKMEAAGVVLAAWVIALLTAAPAGAATVAYWQFNANSTTDPTTFAADSGPNTLNLTNHGAVSSTDVPTTSLGQGPFDPSPNPDSASFGGSSYLESNSTIPLSGNTAVTLEWFMKKPNSNAVQILLELPPGSGGNGGISVVLVNNKLEVVLFGNSNDHVIFTIPTVATVWHEYAVVLNPAAGLAGTDPDIQLYVDDTLVTGANRVIAGAGNTSFSFTNQLLDIGERSSNSTDAYTGLLDQVRISTGALAPGQFLDDLPEPASLSLLGAGALVLLRRRRVG